jgi:heme/copper-type cytochrome/quinol oxidase subunit 3
MFFLSLLSAYFVVKSRAFSTWVPPEDVRLPVLITAVNTAILIASGLSLVAAERLYGSRETKPKAVKLYQQALLLGVVFLAVQGYEWLRLISLGFTIDAGLFSATFFLLIGSHAAHAAAALLVMAFLWPKLRRHALTLDQLRAMTVFWLFVVGVWPILFGTVYFN